MGPQPDWAAGKNGLGLGLAAPALAFYGCSIGRLARAEPKGIPAVTSAELDGCMEGRLKIRPAPSRLTFHLLPLFFWLGLDQLME